MNVLLKKRKIRNKYPILWEFFKELKWYLKIIIPNSHPFLITKPLKTSPKKIKDKKKILFFAVRQDPHHIACEFTLAQALKIRGHEIVYIACDGLIRNICNERCYPKLRKYVCKRCHLFTKKFYSLVDFKVNWLSKYDSKEIENINIDNLDFNSYKNFEYQELPIGELVRPSICHFCRVENIELVGADEPIVRKIYKNFIIGAIKIKHICENILSEYSPDIIIMINGLFASERIMYELSKRKNIKNIIIESGLRPNTLFVLHNNYIDYGKAEGWENRKLISLTKVQEEKLEEYMLQRRKGSGQAIDYWETLNDDKDKIRNRFELIKYKKIIVLFPNVTWDSALFGLKIFFDTLKDWISKTILYFNQHPELCLIIRNHPADIAFECAMRDSIYSCLSSVYENKLSENIKIIPPDDQISSYALMEMSDLGLVYASTTGLEMALIGKPVIVVGKVHYWNKGFTLDPATEDDYYVHLNQILLKEEKMDINFELAKRYAYFIFFEASLELKLIDTNNFREIPKLKFSSYEDLLPGKDIELDAICDGILEGKPFIV
ncbi:MAG: hypothetical protein HY934_03080 [Candidatus Firestonebacteria bacterium]|nr:hypothetical protein [Candidatus Firestonebacteria bacterium]